MRRGILCLAVVLAALLVEGSSANAQITLRFSPQDTTIAPGNTGRLSIMLDEAINVRTIDLRVSFDPTIVGSLGGAGGALYTDSGFQLFQGFEESAPGEWYGYTVIIGADDYIVGPGELYYWDFEALVEGTSPVTDVQTYMSAGDGTWYEDVVISPTTIIVGDPLSAVEDLPSYDQGLRLWPNPFNPRTEIFVELDQAGWVELGVYDLSGRQVVVLHQGLAPAGTFTRTWDGFDSRGLAQPGGVYLFRLATPAGPSGIKGVLLK
jgi:hypothetical protein